MEEDKKSTAVQPEEAPKPKPRRRKAASPQSAADTPPAPTDSAEPPAADGQTTKKPAASPKKPRAKKNTKTTKTAKPKTPKAAKTAKKAPADETQERKAPAQESPVPAAPGFETGPEPKSESKPEPPETPAREDAAASTVPDVPSTPELPEPAERAEPAGTEPELTADAPAADDTPAAEVPPEATAADTAVTDTPEQTGDVPAEDAAEPSGLVFSDDLANDKALAAEAARTANISRTAQLSIAQIMAGLEEAPAPSAGPAPAPEAPQHDSAADDEDDEPQDTIPQALGRGVFGMFKWLLLVVLFVLIIAGGGVAWLYRSATPDMLPEVKVTFDGQELAPTAYKWHVPVVGSFFRRTYAETLNSSPVVLEDAISDASPDIIVTPSDYSTQLTITDADTDLIVKWRNTPSVVQNFIFRQTFTPEMHRSWLATKVATGQVVQYIILDNADGKPVGSVYYRDIDNHNRSAEYGIFIGEESARGKGLGTEAARLFTDFGFAGLHLHRISLRVLAENAAARRSYEKAGFVQEGVFRDMELLDGAYRDVVFMAKLAEN